MKKLILAIFFTTISSVVAYANINITIDHVNTPFDVSPLLINDRTMLPMRSVFYAIQPGVEVNWFAETQTVQAITVLGDTIYLSIGAYDVIINYYSIEIDVPPQLINGFTFVPVRVVAESLGAYVEWDGSTSTVYISRRESLQEESSQLFMQYIILQDFDHKVNMSDFERQVFDLVNEVRHSYGLEPLIWNEYLAQAARYHSEDMATNNFISHAGSDGSQVPERMNRVGLQGFFAWAENVAIGQQTPEQVMYGWMNSPGHRANILRNIRYIGIGVKPIEHQGFQIFAWTQKFMS